jgi:hypothetical protein
MVAYRAETAMANVLRESLTRPDEARTLLCAIYKTEADLVPDYKNKTLTVRLHHLAQQRSDDPKFLSYPVAGMSGCDKFDGISVG